MALTAAHWLQIELVLLPLQVFFVGAFLLKILLSRVKLQLHLGYPHVSLADLLSLLRQQSFVMTLLLGKFLLVLGRQFESELFHLDALLGLELLTQNSFHLLVDVVRCLSVVHD